MRSSGTWRRTARVWRESWSGASSEESRGGGTAVSGADGARLFFSLSLRGGFSFQSGNRHWRRDLISAGHHLRTSWQITAAGLLHQNPSEGDRLVSVEGWSVAHPTSSFFLFFQLFLRKTQRIKTTTTTKNPTVNQVIRRRLMRIMWRVNVWKCVANASMCSR